jgi:uncharacterized protein (TIGR02001 family)
MKRINGMSRWALWAGISCALATGALADGLESEVAVDVPLLSAYVWRGQVLNKDAVLQPGLTGSFGGFSVNAWSSMNLDGTDTDGEFTEMDWTVAYSQAVGPVELGAGIVQYTFPNSTIEDEEGGVSAYPGTVEIFASIGAPDVGLGPALTVYYDVDEIEGLYAVLSAGHSFALAEKVALELSASLGFGDKDYNAGYFGYDKSALNDLVLGAALPIALTENITLTPSISTMLLPDSSLGDAAEAAYGEKDSVYGGVTLSCAF